MIKILISIIIVILGFALFDMRSDVADAVKGHTEDIISRVTHDNEHIVGQVISNGMFRQDDVGRDAIHWADGTVSKVKLNGKMYIQLESNFNSGPAPDLYIYGANQKVFDEVSFEQSNPTEISKLKAGSGAQYYEISQDFSEIIIWCKRFGEFIGSVSL